MALQESERFPKTYGNFPMQSNDGVIFHFPHVLLAYMSPVFNDMFSLSSTRGQGNGTQDDSPLEISEDSAVLEQFLSHLDPKTAELTIDEATISRVLELARKYQVHSIMDWFEKEVISLRVPIFSSTSARSLLTTNPSLVLYLATTYDLPQTARIACKILAGCDSSLLNFEGIGISLKVYLYVSKLRQTRIFRYKGYIKYLLERQKIESAPDPR
ncbi:hypothetical protein CPB86DRAFT_871951 [Serendipita vermifera]|nr:hypothetical protein CPB86DRAFT_871951 [Serendipita vermifera]